ncbi:hypothetical protein ACFWBF_12810 [Streptomyces sp. NPDC060028]|uniref:hypothetical protein n=1 Tax=Streptomyces sp. NPDC060028 TaxID=3347041 RepID=UPI0036CBFAAD
MRTARQEFHAACRALLPSGSSAPESVRGCLGCTGVLLCAEFSFSRAALLDRVPRGGPVRWAAAVATGLALVAQGPHPALVELAGRDPQGVTRLRISRMRTRRGRNRGRPRRRVEHVGYVERGARP